MAQEKISRKELLYSPDKFIKSSQKIFKWILENPKKIITIIAGILILVIIGAIIFTWQKSALNKRKAIYNQAQGHLEKKEVEDAIIFFKVLTEDYPKSKQSLFAKLQLAYIYQNENNIEKAIAYTQAFLKEMKVEEDTLRPFILDKLAQLLEENNRLDEAVANYELLLEFPYMKEKALLSLARVYKAQNNYEKAYKNYEVFIAEFPFSALQGLAHYNITFLKNKIDAKIEENTESLISSEKIIESNDGNPNKVKLDALEEDSKNNQIIIEDLPLE